MAKTKSVAFQMKKILDDFDERVNDVLKEAGRTVANESATRLKDSSPKDSGAYAESWTVKEENGNFIVHNADHYQLTHLLENGHVIKNKYGTYGRWSPGEKHIKPVETWANRTFQRRIQRGLS